MALNYFMDFLFWFFGVLDFVGTVGGLLAFAFLLWLTCSQHGKAVLMELRLDEERRCRHCKDGMICDAAFTGVAWPCPYFEEKE